jgi:hypothetical protein
MQIMAQSLHSFVTQNNPTNPKKTKHIVYATSVPRSPAYVSGNMSIYEHNV